MSGIAGILWLDGRSTEPAVVAAMLTAIGHRGTEPPRMSVSSLSCIGELPRSSHTVPQCDTSIAVVADARLDCKDEPNRILLPCKEDNDTEALLSAAYQRWGPLCAKHLAGDFAFAIWDEHRQQLVCARDHLGVRPLYYSYCPGKLFAFASEVKAILAIPGFVARVDDASIADFLARFVDRTRTFYEGVYRLPPAHTLTVSYGAVTLRRYWSPSEIRVESRASDAEQAHVFREIFTEAVRCRLNSDATIGAELSGGLDSSSVVGTARHLLRGKPALSTFSLLLIDTAYGDERPYIDAVTRSGELRTNYIDVTHRSPLRYLAEVTHHSDGPAGNQLTSDFWELYERAAACKVGVMLDGCEGDLTVYYHFRYLGELARHLRWSSMLREARALNRQFFRGQRSTTHLMSLYCASVLLPSWNWLWNARQSIRRFTGSETELPALISNRFAAESGLDERLEMRRREISTLHSYHDFHVHALASPSTTVSLEIADHLGAAFSIEHRHPFHDIRLVEFCLGLPRDQFVSNGWVKPILRRALVDLLPVELRQRGDKAGTVAPRRLANLGRRALEETADDDALGYYLDMNRLRQLTRRYLDGNAYPTDSGVLWPALSLRYWLRSPDQEVSELT